MVATLLLIVIYISFISLGLPDSLLGSTWPSMYGGMSIPLSYAGIISIIISAGTVVSSIFSARLIKRFGTGPVTAASVLSTAAALLGFSLSGSFAALCVCAVPLGLGAGSVDAALNNYVALHYKARHMSWLHCFWGVGAAIGPIIISFYLSNAGWRSGYRTISLIQFGLVAIILLSLPLWKKVGGITAEPGEDSGASLTLIELLRLPGAKPALTSFFCYCAIEATTGLWGGSFLVIVKGISPETAAKWISLYYFGITLGRFLSGFLTVKLDHRQMIRLGQWIITAGIVLLFLPFGGALLPAGLFMIGLGCAPVFPSLLHETPENFGSENSQAIIGLQMACAYIGIMVVPPLFGVIASRVGYELFPLYLGIPLAAMAFMIRTLNRTVDAARGQRQ